MTASFGDPKLGFSLKTGSERSVPSESSTREDQACLGQGFVVLFRHTLVR